MTCDYEQSIEAYQVFCTVCGESEWVSTPVPGFVSRMVENGEWEEDDN